MKSKNYEAEAKKRWGNTAAYNEYVQKSAAKSPEVQKQLGTEMMALFSGFGQLKENSPSCDEVAARVEKLQNFITAHYYTCTDEILLGLGQLYTEDEAFTRNIDAAGGTGTAKFVQEAIKAFVAAKQNTISL